MKRIILAALTFVLLFASCQKKQTVSKDRELSTNWTFKNIKEDKWLSAVVPGSIHQDLMDHKIIPDPFIGENEKKVQWVEKETWEYQTTFELSEEEQQHQFIDLNFDGLDTYTSIYLNDSLLGQTDNMFIAYSFTLPVQSLKASNTLRVVLHSPTVEGEKIKALTEYTIPVHSEQLLDTNQIATSNLTRKAHYHYGWDWGPRIVTSGIWKPITLKAWTGAKIVDVFHQLKTLSDKSAEYSSQITIESEIDQKIDLSINISNGIDLNIKKSIQVKKGINLVELPFSIEKPIFWYPHNYGDPYMYDTKIELSADGRLSDSKDLALGVRELKIIQKPDSIGTSFYVEVNGTPVFCKGSNYISPHFFNGRLKKEDYQRVIQDAKDANMNMLRVWGGGVYEKEEFYELCDREGILIWQDFMFACNMYRGDEAFLKSVEKEATQNVKRLRNHPSVALWIGNNEILRAWTEWGWQARFALDSTQCDVIWKDYQKIFYSILDKAVKENDPGKLYWPSSPSATFDTKENHKSGDSHFWDVWFGQKPFQFYHDLDCRFVSEFGFVSYPDKSTLLRFAGGDTSLIGINTPFMADRQRCKMDWMKLGMNGNLLVKQYMEQYYGVFNDFSDFIYVSQLMHADAIKNGIEAFRMDKPRNMGALYWQIDDCWPTVSWSSVDFYGNWKAPHYAAKRANSDLFILGEWQKDNFVVKAGFDGLSSREVKTSFVLLDENGALISEKTQKANLTNTDNVTLYSITKKELNTSLVKSKCILLTCVSKNDSVSNLYFLDEMKSFIPKSKEITIKAVKTEKGYTLEVSSNSIQKGVRLSTGVKGKFSDNYFDLIPGNVHRVSFETESKAKPKVEVKAFGWNRVK